MTISPLFIIGAGRSGTNILRDTLTSIAGWETWPCDEINLIWRHGNRDKADDLFGSGEATPYVTAYLRGVFERFGRKTGARVVVEKTCANSLRVPFLDAVFPDARYVFMVRDGRDVALSAARRWTAPVEPAYLLRKLPYVPAGDVPHYAMRFFRNRLHQMRSQEKRQASWGPRFPGMDEWVRSRPLIDVCARQWAECVDRSDTAFAKIDDDRVWRMSYEKLVANPQAELVALAEWAGEAPSAISPAAIADINAASAGTWTARKSVFTRESLEIMSATLKRNGYGPSA